VSAAAGEVVVVETGVANLASVESALRRLGATPRRTRSPGDVESARAVVLPGVGAFAAAMAALRAHGLVEPLRARVEAGGATLAVCLGMQLLGEGSEEAPGVAGVGAFPGVAARFPEAVRAPLLGWSRIEPQGPCQLLEPAFVYFAHSYRFTSPPPGWAWAKAEHAGPFVAALERGSALACQFHPELSSAAGLSLLGRWLRRAGVGPSLEAPPCPR